MRAANGHQRRLVHVRNDGAPQGPIMNGQTVWQFREWCDFAGLRPDDRYLIVNPFFHASDGRSRGHRRRRACWNSFRVSHYNEKVRWALDSTALAADGYAARPTPADTTVPS